MTSVLITGVTGFVGHHLGHHLMREGCQVVGTTRSLDRDSVGSQYVIKQSGEIDENTDWDAALNGIEVVVHLAARVHVMRETELDPLDSFRRVNTRGTQKLLTSAARCGVKRFVFVSTIKVHGESTTKHPFSRHDRVAPQDPYAVSKLEAEHLVSRISGETGIESVIIRPPLIYGPGVGGNFLRMLKLARLGLPLPLGSIDNRRSMLGISNFCDLLHKALTHPDAAGKVWLVSDDDDISTAGLFRLICRAMHKSSRLFPCPERALRWAGRIAGRSGEVSRLCESLQVDISDTKRVLNWSPPTSMAVGVQSTVDWYLSRENSSNV